MSHEIRQTLSIADHVIILAEGRVTQQGSVDEIRASTDPLVHQYINALPDGPVGFHYPAVALGTDFGLRALP